MITKIPNGWPPAKPSKIATGPRPEKAYLWNANRILHSDEFQSWMYSFCGESRDIDIEFLRIHLNARVPSDEAITRAEMPFVLNQVAIDFPKTIT